MLIVDKKQQYKPTGRSIFFTITLIQLHVIIFDNGKHDEFLFKSFSLFRWGDHFIIDTKTVGQKTKSMTLELLKKGFAHS